MEWAEVLDDMDARLVAAERVLHSGGPPPDGPRVPPGMGPLPDRLIERARRVQLDTDRLAGRIIEARSLVLSAMHRRPPRDVRPPAYVDTQA